MNGHDPCLNPAMPLPHEIGFGALLLLFTLALWWRQGPVGMDFLVFLSLTLVALALFLATRNRSGLVSFRLRLLFHPIAINVVFQQMRTAVPAIHPRSRDDLLLAFDHLLLPDTPALLLEQTIHPWLTEVLSFCYLLFMPYLFFSMIYYLFAPPPVAVRFHVGLFVLYGAGFLGYLLVPAGGPWLALADRFTLPLAGGWLTDINAAMVTMGSNRVDVFPSLHAAVSTYLLFFDRRFKPWRFWLYLLPCLGLWFSTLYLRYHYLGDLLAGFFLAALCLGLAFSPRLRWKETP